MKWPAKSKGIFYESVRITLLLLRYIGLFPLSGLTQSRSELTRFNLVSPYVIVHAFSLAIVIGVEAIHVYDIIAYEVPSEVLRIFAATSSIINIICVLLMIQFGINWKTIMKMVEDIEKYLPTLRSSGLGFHTKNKLLASLLCIGLVEYCIYTLYTIRMAWSCEFSNANDSYDIKKYFLTVYYWFYRYFSFNYVSGVILKLSKFQSSLSWTLANIFVDVVFLYLISKFKDFNEIFSQNLQEVSRNGTIKVAWSDLQVYYTRLTKLVMIIDGNINILLFVVLNTNAVFLGEQIFYLLTKKNRNNAIKLGSCGFKFDSNLEVFLYQLFPLVFFMVRLCFHAFLAAYVHTLSRKPLDALYTIPSAAYNKEVQKFLDQVYHCKVCLTGLGFYHVTFGMILSLFTTLITYELMLFQLNR